VIRAVTRLACDSAPAIAAIVAMLAIWQIVTVAADIPCGCCPALNLVVHGLLL
jgi:hypothetical protein